MTWLLRFVRAPASGWLAVALVALVMGLGWYIAELREDAAYCEGQQSTAPAIERLTKRVTKEIEQQAHDDVQAIKDSPDACSTQPAPPAVLDSLRQ